MADEGDRPQFTSRELLFGTVQRRGETVPLDGRDAGETGRVAIAQTVFHEKESLVAVRSINNGLVMHFMYFPNEVHDFDQISKVEGEKVPQREIDLGKNLIDKMSAVEFEPEKITTNTGSGFLR